MRPRTVSAMPRRTGGAALPASSRARPTSVARERADLRRADFG
jgi:hypothetical protein